MTKCAKMAAALVICLSFSGRIEAQAKSFDILTPEVKQGGTLVLKIDNNFLDGQTAIKAFDKVYWPNEKGLVFVGIDYISVNPGKYMIYLWDYITEQRADWYYDEIVVADGNFEERPWPFGSRKGTPVETKKRKEERRLMDDALNYSYRDPEERYIDGKFTPPLQRIEVVEEFGVKRISRGVVVEHHGGVDLRTNDPYDPHDQKSKPITAVNSGRVVLARRFSLEGNMAIIYHGQGVYSLYMHMSQLKVKVNQIVRAGLVMGLSGNTGRVTGPHLDFRVKINNSYVDPLAFIETANQYLE